MSNRRLTTRVSALALSVSLAAAACGGGSDEDTSGDTAASEPADAPAQTDGAEPAPDEPAPESTDEADADADQESSTTPAPATTVQEDEAEEDAAAPRTVTRGGTLSFLLEAETDTWDIPSAQCAMSCLVVMSTVADPLTVVNDQGEIEPFLLESYEANDDFTVHTLTMRDGVTFHDGSIADGAALRRNLVEMANGVLIGTLLVDLENGTDGIVQVDDMTVEVRFSRPFATFGWLLTDRMGWLLAPSFWDDPDRRATFPVGTGAFRMTDWARGERTTVEANPDYWRTDGTGEPLPYLDAIEFRPVDDNGTRRSIMESGDADVAHDSAPQNIGFWTTEWEGQLADLAPDRDLNYLLFNLSEPPFDDPDLRRALALCTDREEYMAFRAPDTTLARGPFAEGSIGHLADPGFPSFDPAAGNAILDEIGRPDSLRFSTTNTQNNLVTTELIADMWSTNCDINVEIDQFEQTELITRALTADFGVMTWRNHGRPSPALEIQTWHSRHASGIATNVGRLMDPELDALLFDALATVDRSELDAIGQEITRIFADEVYAIWLNTNLWSVPYRDGVDGIGTLTIPSGGSAQAPSLGATRLTEASITG